MVDESDDIYFSNPNVTFSVSTTSGMVLGTYNTGSLAVTSSEFGAIWILFYNGN
jgi:hypothetical protein